jgi:hypothetical protein
LVNQAAEKQTADAILAILESLLSSADGDEK